MGGIERTTESERASILEARRRAGEELRREAGLDAEAADRVREVFQKAIVGEYWTRLQDYVTKEMGVSVPELARKLGVNKGTPYRWLVRDLEKERGAGQREGANRNGVRDGLEKVPDSRKDSLEKLPYAACEPSLRSFLLTLTAFDIDPAEDGVLPRGSCVALWAYCTAFDYLERVELGRDAGARILPEEVLCLHFAIRSVPWREAVDRYDAGELRQAAGNIFEQVEYYIEVPQVRSIDRLRSVLEERMATWVILETVLTTYDWF